MIGTIFAFIPIGWDGHSTQAFAIDYGPIEPKSRKSGSVHETPPSATSRTPRFQFLPLSGVEVLVVCLQISESKSGDRFVFVWGHAMVAHTLIVVVEVNR